MNGKRGWIVLILFIVMLSQVVAVTEFNRLYIKVDNGGDNELWWFIDGPSTKKGDADALDGCDLNVKRESGGADENRVVAVRRNTIVSNDFGHSFSEYVVEMSNDGNVNGVLNQQWKAGMNSKCGNDGDCYNSCCPLAASTTEYRPGQELLCGSDDKWRVCDVSGERVGPFSGGFTAECQPNGKWKPIEICCNLFF